MRDEVPWNHGRYAARGRRTRHACRSRTAQRRCYRHPRASADWYRGWCCAFPSGRRCAFPCAKSQSPSSQLMHLLPTASARYAAFPSRDDIHHPPRTRLSMRQCLSSFFDRIFLNICAAFYFEIRVRSRGERRWRKRRRATYLT